MASSDDGASAPADVNVTVLGLGRMGVAVAERLLDAGFSTHLWNRTPGRSADLEGAGARVFGSAVEAVAGSDVVLTSVTDGAALVDLLIEGGVLARMARSVLVDLSTVGLADSAQVADTCAQHDVGYVRAPISGNPSVVRSGAATVFVSGADSQIDRCRRVLDTIAGRIKVVGEVDEARVIKLAVNLVLAGTAELLAEAVILGEAHDVDRSVVLDALNESVLGSAFSRYKTDAALARDYTPTFTTADLAKDVRLILDEAAKGGVTLPLAARTSELLGLARVLGHGERDFMSLLPTLQELSGQPGDLSERRHPSAGV